MRSLIASTLIAITSCTAVPTTPVGIQPCTNEWFESVEQNIPTGDGQGHGPDIGSSEWRSVIEFKLGIRDDPSVPALESAEWCTYIDRRIFQRAT